jgi:predicted O-methyltransferase YrrM
MLRNNKYLDKIVPRAVAHYSTLLWDRVAFDRLQAAACDTTALALLRDFDATAALRRTDLEQEWRSVAARIAALGISNRAGGVNPGDRRAVYHLIRYLRPKAVLEIGTHVGASTVHIAAALAALRAEDPSMRYELTTVDIVDVNDEAAKPWLELGSRASPQQMIEELGCSSFVSFHAQNSLDYLAACGQRFDLIFLDGFHAATHVLHEIPAALAKLKEGGYVLLHDYYPNQQPLWSDGHVERGPFLAVEKLRRAGAQIEVLPFGALPWPTKVDSNVTSLALLGRR